MPTPTDKVSVIARLTAAEGKRDDVLAAFETFLEAVQEEEGTELYSFHLDQADPNVMWIIEMYTNKAAMDAHGASPAFMELLGNLGGLVDGFPDMSTATPAAAKGLSL